METITQGQIVNFGERAYQILQIFAEIDKEDEEGHCPMSDCEGWFNRYENINLYIEVISRDKALKDSTQRNKISFKV